ncbi:peptidylprolyl isomerase [Photorhabdus laumondii subsp. laumondii]|uniref:Periplasmic chaperone PpiD n=2 Tax=Photorhabdus laumondii subsp. laumondii TaxID=141679 RepID=Q7N0L7_PHOLL|nr:MULTISPECIES: peptidylprolyl isomerase [Photorhabdus]AWK43473.1 peptidylprolyl isomerase [Photorhabdus laumondii subsp. laumondii]AXG44151.1 peptidylprolyl isomerase [Photorhabdus laumondii subsp. laumondii]AXG48779.1 peptidylprolyl isomerase [Photorhabdus laumondii subsp. laumondii]KTL63431.1 molecular chaperone [Photorhabdus laumondii subsp. laumondii]MCC8383020.1 peptidylprolyl isomerase [Photorhabdus laumondii]
MMDNLRTAANSPVLKIVLALIILSFVLTGVGGYLTSGAGSYAAEVNGQAISRAQLEQAFQQERNALQEQLGDKFSVLASDEQSMKQIRNQALDRLINNALIDQYSRELGLSASDEQVKDSIRNTSYFQTDGKFDNNKYLELLNRFNMSPDIFAEQTRQNLVNQQLIMAFSGSEIALPGEVKLNAELLLQQRTARIATLELKKIQAQQEVTDKDLQDYYNLNKSSFIASEEVKISYIKMDAVDEMNKVSATSADVDAYYEHNLKRYTQPEQKKYSLIQLATESEARTVFDELNKGADFGKLATKKSTDKFSAKNHGEIGWMEEDALPEELKQANLKEKGQISSVIKVPNGFAIFHLDDVKPQIIKPLSEVRSEIEKMVKQEKAVDAFYALQQKVSDAATSDNESLAAAEEVSGIKVVTTDWFDRNSVPAEINFGAVIHAIFEGNLVDGQGPTGTNSDVISVEGDRAFVLRVDNYKPETVQPFEKVKDQVTELVKRQKAEKQLQVESEKLLTALKEGKGEQALKDAGIQFGESQVIQRTSQDNVLVGAVFALPLPKEGKAEYGLTKNSLDDVVLIQLDKVTPGVVSEEQIKSMTDGYQSEMGNAMLESLLISLREKAKIKLGHTE